MRREQLQRLVGEWGALAFGMLGRSAHAGGRCHAAALPGHGGQRRGSVLILVIAILAILILLSVSLSYTTRIELLAARNWANTVQAKQAAVTGVPLFSAGTSNAGMSAPKSVLNLSGSSGLKTRVVVRESTTGSGSDTTSSSTSDSTTRARLTADDLQPLTLGLRPEALVAAASGNSGTTADGTNTTKNNAGDGGLLAGGQRTSSRSNNSGVRTAGSTWGSGTSSNSAASSLATAASAVAQDPAAALAQFALSDASAQLNLNALLPTAEQSAKSADQRSFDGSSTGVAYAPPQPGEAALKALITAVFQQKGISQPQPQALARAIVLRRYGADGAPGVAGQDDERTAYEAWELASQLTQNNATGSGTNTVRGTVAMPPVLDPASDGLDNDRDGKIDNSDEDFEHDGRDNNFDGEIDEAGEAIDNPAESLSDPRQTPAGDDRPWGAVSELMDLPGMTAAAYAALEPYFTVYSASFAAWQLPASSAAEAGADVGERIGFPQVDPNTAPAELIYEELRRRLPEASQDLLAQFTANLVDRRDSDQSPTELSVGGKNYWGIERTPVINEICADTASFDEEGDDGQYIELYNPYDQPFTLTGWTIQGAGPNIVLSGSLPAGGYLVLTNDYKNDNDKSPEPQANGMGSFYDLFGIVATGGLKQIMEFPQLDLSNDGGEVRLLNAKGALVDVFAYTDARWTGAPLSHQRVDPRLRYCEKQTATPLAPNANYKLTTAATEALRVVNAWQDQPFRSALDVMLVSAAWVETTTRVTTATTTSEAQVSVQSTPHAWAMPVLSTADASGLDVRIIDCFRVGSVLPPKSATEALESATENTIDARQVSSSSSSSRGSSRASLSELQSERDALQAGSAPRCELVPGLLNINTAPIVLLQQLPGMTESLAGALHDARWRDWMDAASAKLDHTRTIKPNQALFDYWQSRNPLDPPRWRNLSDFLLDDYVWGDRPLYDRLDAAYPFFGQLTTHGQAIRVDTANLVASAAGAKESLPSRASASRLLSAERGAAETLTFRYTGLGSLDVGDSDLRYGVQVGRVRLAFDTDAMLREARAATAAAGNSTAGQTGNSAVSAQSTGKDTSSQGTLTEAYAAHRRSVQ